MAPRILAEPLFTTQSERDVWQRLCEALSPADVLAGNLRITDKRGDHELDIIAGIAEAGVVVLEVKGGSVSHDGHSWWTESGGKQPRHIEPVEQARRGKYALRDLLDADPRWARRRVRLAHALAFPFTTVRADFALPDCPREIVFDRGDLAPDADVVARLLALLDEQETDNPPATKADLDVLLEVLRGRGLPQRDLVAMLAEREEQIDLRSAQQQLILDVLRLIPRVSVVGGAGSGKTYLALEQARRLAHAGQRVALTCYSRGLASYLRRHTATWPRREQPAYVGGFHGLGRLWGAPEGSDDDSDFWERRLPEQMVALAAEQPAGQRFDAVVVDEAQDFADSWWPALLAALKDDETGGVYVFGDEGQRVFARQGRPPLTLVPIALDENIRNTVEIAETFGPLATSHMRCRGGGGPPVRFLACEEEDAVATADDEVDALLEEGWPMSSVALLTTGRRHPEHRARQEVSQDSYWDSFWDDDQVFYGHVLGFKGLERPVVVLALNGFSNDGRTREKLYVGLSRARDLLVVCGDPDAIRSTPGGEAVLRRLTGGAQ